MWNDNELSDRETQILETETASNQSFENYQPRRMVTRKRIPLDHAVDHAACAFKEVAGIEYIYAGLFEGQRKDLTFIWKLPLTQQNYLKIYRNASKLYECAY